METVFTRRFLNMRIETFYLIFTGPHMLCIYPSPFHSPALASGASVGDCRFAACARGRLQAGQVGLNIPLFKDVYRCHQCEDQV